jgi:hypothetical protein
VEDLLTFRMGPGAIVGAPDRYPIVAAILERNLAGFGPPKAGWGYARDEWLRPVSANCR